MSPPGGEEIPALPEPEGTILKNHLKQVNYVLIFPLFISFFHDMYITTFFAKHLNVINIVWYFLSIYIKVVKFVLIIKKKSTTTKKIIKHMKKYKHLTQINIFLIIEIRFWLKTSQCSIFLIIILSFFFFSINSISLYRHT